MPDIDVISSEALPPSVREEVLALCEAAYEEDVRDLFATFGPATHILLRVEGVLASHAMWVTRWLQPGAAPPLMTAYVEMVATLPASQGKGYATRVMERLAREIPEAFGLAALCTGTHGFYERLGWRLWRGPLSIRMPSGALEPTPEERVMVLELPGRPALGLDEPLSAEWREGELW